MSDVLERWPDRVAQTESEGGLQDVPRLSANSPQQLGTFAVNSLSLVPILSSREAQRRGDPVAGMVFVAPTRLQRFARHDGSSAIGCA